MPIDYSKWDNLDEYSSDDDNEQEQESSNNMPRVTQLDGPSQVTFGGGAANITTTSLPSTTTASNCTSTDTRAPKNRIPVTSTKKTTTTTSKNPNPTTNNNETEDASCYDSWKEKGGMISINNHNDQQQQQTTSRRRRLYWSQDRYSVVLRLELLSPEEKIKAVEVTGAVSYQDRFCAVGTTKPILQVFSKESSSSLLLLNGELTHPVHYAEEDDDEIEWSIERSPRNERFLTITLYKAVPVQGVSIWWQSPLMGYDNNNDEIGDGNSALAGGVDDARNQRSQSFQKAWEEAHKQFQERRQHGKRTAPESDSYRD